MLGVVSQISNNGISLLVNKEPFCTELKFIPDVEIESKPTLEIGSKVSYDGKVITLTEYVDCEKCHRPIELTGSKECDCEHQDRVAAGGQLIKMEMKMYPTGLGLKIAIQCGRKTLNSVLFQGTVMYEIVNRFHIGEIIHFKALIIKSSENTTWEIFFMCGI